ncbi:unnamed protein product [Clavelina lepadiformis]|uniref:Cadherin-like beta-sandwich-like domain-containing protein n=1 Tax=Clavelina lepadiformis TaxID=159417 RepID=A0ABP0FI64_CLALP
MDDCDLEKLSATPAKLSPKFNRNTTEYEATVPSSVEKVKVDCLTSDTGASYQVFGAGGEKTIPLKEGDVTEIKIEVSAEDGTTKSYIIRIKRLSASDASLNQLSLSCGKLDPPFAMDQDEYTCILPCSVESVTVKPVAPDKKCVIVVAGSEPDFLMPLQLGETKIITRVSSVDGTNTKDYTITVVRKQLPWPVTLKDLTMAMKYECPMSLSPLYIPISIAGSDPKASMSQPCIDMLTRRSKVNPLNDSLLDKDWRVIDSKLDKEISSCVANSVYAYKGVKDEVIFSKMANHIKSCDKKPPAEVDSKQVTDSAWYKAEFESSSAKAPDFNHTVQVRNWEKRLQHMASGNSADSLVISAEENLASCKKKLPKKPGQTVRYVDGESPFDDVQKACIALAAAIKDKSKVASHHLKLAYALEEKHHLSEIFGFSDKEESAEVGAGTDVAAKESSKLEECQAICRLRGVAPNAPIALQLKAIDEEYKSLLESGQSGRADHVQSLYVWRSKQAVKNDLSGLQQMDESDPLSQAYLKYMDALAIDQNNYICNLHVGRMMLQREEYDEAVKRLQQAVGLKPGNVESRLFLGFALCQRKGGAGDRRAEALGYLHDGLDHFLMRRQNEAETEEIILSSSSDVHAEDIMRPANVQLIHAFVELAKNLKKSPQEGMRSAKEIYHCICLHVSMVLCSLFHKGFVFQQLEMILLNCQYALLEILIEERPNDTKWISQRCLYLSAMIRSTTIPRNKPLLALQEKVSQKLVSTNPCSSESLYLLGLSQLMIYDNNGLDAKNDKPLVEARLSLEASLEMEGKPASGEPPSQIKGQKWWQNKVAAEKATQEAAQPPKSQPAARGRGAALARGRAPARGVPPTRGTAAGSRGRGAAKTAPPARGRGAPARGATRGGFAASTASSSDVKCEKSNEQKKRAAESTPATATAASAASVDKNAPINRASYQTRLALARAYSRTDDRINEVREKYEEVMKMAPEVHDSYIELAELLVKTDPLAAVDIYCR